MADDNPTPRDWKEVRKEVLEGSLSKKELLTEFGDYAETHLMWAMWEADTASVEKLLEMGADLEQMNHLGHGALTYWDVTDAKKVSSYCQIAENLHRRGVRLDQD